MNKMLQFEGSPEEIASRLNQFQNELEVDHRKGWFGLRGLFSKDLPKDQKEKIDFARQLAQQLGQDAKKGKLEGQLDLAGWNQQAKRVRTGKTRSGRAKNYYRDPWFTARAKMVDGNVATVSAVELVKHKPKRGTVVKRQRLGVRLLVNDHVYLVSQSQAQPISGKPESGIRAIAITSKGGQTRLGWGSDNVTPGAAMAGLRATYGCLDLQRKQKKAVGG